MIEVEAKAKEAERRCRFKINLDKKDAMSENANMEHDKLSEVSGNSFKNYKLLKRIEEEKKITISQVGLGLISFNLKCLAGPFRNENINLSLAP